MPPTEYLIAALIKAISGMVSATVLSFFWRPKALRNKSSFVAGSMTGGISASAAIMLTGLVMQRLGMDENSFDHIMAAACLVGLLSIPLVGSIARYFEKREDKDIVELWQGRPTDLPLNQKEKDDA